MSLVSIALMLPAFGAVWAEPAREPISYKYEEVPLKLSLVDGNKIKLERPTDSEPVNFEEGRYRILMIRVESLYGRAVENAYLDIEIVK